MGMYVSEKLANKELQLIEEEKWILETLELIKKKRNQLHIETLRLEAEIRDAMGLCNNAELNLMETDHPTLEKTVIEVNPEEEENEEVEVENENEDEKIEDEDEEEDENESLEDILLDIAMLLFRSKMN